MDNAAQKQTKEWIDPKNQAIYHYEILTDQTIRLLSCTGGQSRIEIPGEIEGFPVGRLGRHLFYENGLLVEEVVLPDSIRIIEEEALEFAVCLQKIQLNSGLVYIGKNAFHATQLTSLVIPNTVEWMEEPGEWGIELELEEGNPNYSDDGYGIYFINGRKDLALVHHENPRRSYRLAEDCRGIQKHALFSAQRLEEVILPPSVQEISEAAFSVEKEEDEDPGLSVRIEEGNPALSISQGCILLKRKEDRETAPCSYIAIYGEPDFTGDLVDISQKLNGPLTVIAAEAFYGSKITEVRLPRTLERIGAEAFTDCRLKKAYLEEEDGWTEILFPSEYGYLMNRLLASFGKNGHRYDYGEYDENLLSGGWNLEKLHLSISRLKQGRHLKKETEDSIRERILTDMEEILKLIRDHSDGESLQALSDLHFFTEENTDQAIAFFRQKESGELMSILLNVKQGQRRKSFDFSL